LLRDGISKRGVVYGPMAEVTYDSLQYLTEADAKAMAVYLKSLGEGTPPGKETTSVPMPENSLLMTLGKSIYDAQCATCHGAKGQGAPPNYPPLAGNPSIQMQSAVNPVRMVLNGGYPPGTPRNPMPYGMPPFAQNLSDDEVAAVVTYIRSSWGNRGSPVSAREANDLRKAPLD
jgi:mono/diheme cytochrome c family protein